LGAACDEDEFAGETGVSSEVAHAGLADERGQLVADAEQKDGSDGKAVDGCERRDKRLHARSVGARGKDTGCGGGHERIHDE